MKTKVVLTIDTEPSVGGAITWPELYAPIIDQPVAGIVNGRSEALGFLLSTLVQHGLIATFFVEAIHTRAVPEAMMGRYVDQLLAAGQDVQLHFHPVWRTWRDGQMKLENRSTDMSSEIPRQELAQMLEEGARQIERWTGKRPTAARAGNFSTSRAVLQASADVGIRVTSHINLAHAPPRENELRLGGGVHDLSGVRELPVTCFVDRGPKRGLRPLQINAVSAAEMAHILRQMHRAGAPVAMIVLHPFDFIKRDNKQFHNMRPHRMVQRRWQALCSLLAAERGRFETVTIDDAAALGPASETLLSNNFALAFARSAANYLGDRLG